LNRVKESRHEEAGGERRTAWGERFLGCNHEQKVHTLGRSRWLYSACGEQIRAERLRVEKGEGIGCSMTLSRLMMNREYILITVAHSTPRHRQNVEAVATKKFSPTSVYARIPPRHAFVAKDCSHSQPCSFVVEYPKSTVSCCLLLFRTEHTSQGDHHCVHVLCLGSYWLTLVLRSSDPILQ
jgi:hypothetical protein